MKLYDVYKAVSQLGFEDSLGDDGTTGFLYAVNRALIEINSLRPRRKHVTINHRVPTNLLFSDPTQIEKTETLTFTAKNAKSFYFEVCGKGSYAISLLGTAEGTSTTVKSGSFDEKNFTAIKGIITHNGAFIDTATSDNMTFSGDVELKFEGAYDYSIRNIALYDRVYSDKAEDVVPFTKRIPYKISDIVDDFERFDSSPLEASTYKYLTDKYTVENQGTIYMPLEYPGAYEIGYIHKATLISMDASINDSVNSPLIDLDEDLASLMPSLVASYVWLDDEPEKAQYYYNLYTQRAIQIQSKDKDITPVLFQSTNDW